MRLSDFLEYVKTRSPLDTPDIHRFMDEMSDQARRITFELNNAYHSPDEVRALLSRLFGREVDPTLARLPAVLHRFRQEHPYRRRVFINACCHFQDHGGITIGDDCQIGHNVVFATLNHGPCSRRSQDDLPGRRSRSDGTSGSVRTPRSCNAVTIGDNAVVAAGAVVTQDVPPDTHRRRSPRQTDQKNPLIIKPRLVSN